jgi:hypothetical protein
LVFHQQRFSNDGPSATRSEQASDCYDEVYEKKGEFTYH